MHFGAPCLRHGATIQSDLSELWQREREAEARSRDYSHPRLSMEVAQCLRGGSERGRRCRASRDTAPLFASAPNCEPGDSDRCADHQSNIRRTSGVRKMTDHMSDPVRSYRRRRKLALCSRSYWALLWLQIHVLKAVAQGKETWGKQTNKATKIYEVILTIKGMFNG